MCRSCSSLFAAILLVCVSACTSLVHKPHISNTYAVDFTATVENEAMNFSMCSPADIAYSTDAEQIKLAAKQRSIKVNNVLAHGVAQQHHPFYEFFLLYNPKKIKLSEAALYQQDTLINGQRISLIAFPLEENINKSVENDFEGILSSIVIE
jgi:hypothetical protein